MPQQVYASIGEREGYSLFECVGDDCAVSTLGETGLAIVGLVVLLLIGFVFEKLARKWNEWRWKKKQPESKDV